jgi:hypothetical protein
LLDRRVRRVDSWAIGALGDDPSDEWLKEIIDRFIEVVREIEKIVEEKARLDEGRKLYSINKQCHTRNAEYVTSTNQAIKTITENLVYL